jgi:putative glycosyltransferase (TIGR04348 family)
VSNRNPSWPERPNADRRPRPAAAAGRFADPPTAVTAARRPRVALITPYGAQANNGNWHTAARWARFLRPQWRVQVGTEWDGRDCDLLLALHARRSAASIAAFAAAHPQRPLLVVLTGTDLYRDIRTDAAAQRSLRLAQRLVVLQAQGLEELPHASAAKATIIYQSAPPLAPAARRRRSFDVAVVGHLRDEKDPRLAMALAAGLPAASPVRILHIGAALDPALGRAARASMRTGPHYRWLGALPRGRVRHWLRRVPLLLHPSKMEGGAQAIIEAIQSGAAIIASDCGGNRGLLGDDYAGLFAVGATDAARQLVERAAAEPAFLRRLQQQCARRAPLFAPARERAALQALLQQALHA